jgi:hypothetical protein
MKDFSNTLYKEANIIIKKDFGNYSIHGYFGSNFENEKIYASLYYNF